MRERYPEARLQEACTVWLKGEGFSEIVEDSAALGERVDSVGVWKNRLFLIEYKTSISASIVRHRGDRSMSLESKLAGVLGPLFRRESDPLSQKANGAWDRWSNPVFVVAAGAIPELGLRELRAMLGERAVQWRIDWQVWRWRDGKLSVLAEGLADQDDRPFDEIAIPRLIGRTLRNPRRSLAELREVAAASDVDGLFDAFAEEAIAHGLRLSAQRWTLTAKGQRAGKLIPYAAAYLDKRNCGPPLIVGIDAALLREPAGELPGEPAAAAGFLNTNRALSTEDQIRELFSRFKN